MSHSASVASSTDRVPSDIAPSNRGVSPALLTNLFLAGITIVGAPYYLAPLAQRVRHPLHAWLRPSGYVGQSAGILLFLGFLFLWLYPLRKRARWMSFSGSVGKWLDVHIVVGLTLPILGAVHASWRFNGLIGLGYLAMLIVVASGIIGRYIYSRIPRSRKGVALGLDEATKQRMQLLVELANVTGLERDVVSSVLAASPVPTRGLGLGGTLMQMVRDDFSRRKSAREIVRRWKDLGPDRPPLDRQALRNLLRTARRQMALSQQARLLDATQSLFRFWHVAHLPVAITAAIAVTIHVVVAILFGATWFY
jgi:hypothetical protein